MKKYLLTLSYKCKAVSNKKILIKVYNKINFFYLKFCSF